MRAKKEKVPDAIRAVFARVIADTTVGREPKLALPDPLRVGTAFGHFWDYGREQNYLLELRCVKTDDGRFALDYHSRSNDGQAWSRGRIHEDGREEMTESHFAL